MSRPYRYLAVLSLTFAGALLFAPGVARAEQCIFNRGGFVIEVDWFRIGTIGLYYDSNTKLAELAPPVARNTGITLGTGVCNKSDVPMIAAVRVLGCLGVKIGSNTSSCLHDRAAGDLPVTPVSQSGDSFSYRDPSSGQQVSAPIIKSLNCNNLSARPPACLVSKGLFPSAQWSNYAWIFVPSTTHYLDFFGATIDVQWVEGGPIK